MRLSEYPYVVVRGACSRCARRGSYRLAGLAERYGARMTMAAVLSHLAGDCAHRETRHHVTGFCGAFFPDMQPSRPADVPAPATRSRADR